MISRGEKTNRFPIFDRAGGILLHPTSLPGISGIGDVGKPAIKFIDLLKKYNQRLWQILPLGPTGYGESPYSCLSAFAGNPLLISFDHLQKLGLLNKSDYIPDAPFNEHRVEYEKVIPYKWSVLRKSYNRYKTNPNEDLESEFQIFKKDNKQWLDDFTLYFSIKIAHKEVNWIDWPEAYRTRDPSALNEWKEKNSDQINFYCFIQYLFFIQWMEIKQYAHKCNILIIGDVPIYVALDSADVWANQDLFYLDDTGNPIYVAGVPPDHFSKTGQRWGNPIYRWDVLKKANYHWWVQRINHAFRWMDIIRIDHFRGFLKYWEIPAKNPTAEYGKWIKGPGKDLFEVLKEQIASLPIIAEDLSYYLTSDVHKLRETFGFPGMRILQYAFSQRWGARNRYFPHNYEPNTVAYTGSHDNDTIIAWFKSLDPKTKKNVLQYLDSTEEEVVSKLIRSVWQSVANLAIVPLQDVLRLDNKARMNYPGHFEFPNWRWRFTWQELEDKSRYCEELADFSEIYERKTPFRVKY